MFLYFQAGEAKKGTDKAVFVEILTTRNYAQLRVTFDAYKNVSMMYLFSHPCLFDFKKGILTFV